MFNAISTLVVCLFLAGSAFAQPVAIHGHPEKQAYASPAEWPVDSSQCHWRPGNNNADMVQGLKDDLIMPVFDPKIAHTHLDCAFPRDGEIGPDPFQVSCTAKLFHTDGHIGGLWSPLQQIRDVVWAETGSATLPVTNGDPMGVKEWKVKFTFVPTAPRTETFPNVPPNPHGWSGLILTLRTEYNNGDRVDLDTLRTFYSMLDPSVKESKISDEGLLNGTRCAPNSLRRLELNRSGNQMGVSVSEYVDKLPLGPIQAKFETQGRFYTYASLEGIDPATFKFPDGAFEHRFGVDIHNGIPGTTVDARTLTSQDNQVKIPVVFDPAVMGSGTKNVVQFWRLPDGQGNDVTALYVINVTVGPGVPDPPPVDVCPNIVGVQLTVPPGLIVSGGQCVLPPPPPLVDVCPNLAGAQATVPAGMVLVSGECRPIDPPPPAGAVYTFTCDAAGKCTLMVVKP